MHHGVYRGEVADKRKNRILILGESHHMSKTDENNMICGVPATYTTASVVEEYFCAPEKDTLKFFTKIANSFGFLCQTDKDRRDFWNSVYFGNYIDVLCGVGDDQAKTQIKNNQKKYNDQLFEFVNDNEIDTIFCFGRKHFDAMPNAKKWDKLYVGYVGKKKDYIVSCIYMENISYRGTTVLLNKPLKVYCMRHPSARCGYNPLNYINILAKAFDN